MKAKKFALLPLMSRGIFMMGFLTGCGVGQQNVLFMTKSNVGIDIDSRPPTAEISVARREAVIEPTFEGGQTPPVVASFRSSLTGLWGLFADVGATFGGGKAAVTMTRLYGSDTPQDLDGSYAQANASMCLSEAPTHDAFGRTTQMPDAKDVKAFIFGTDTSFGLKIAWSGLTAQFPDTVRLGYNRKELAWAPIFVRKEECQEEGRTAKKAYTADVASFLATIEHDAKAADPQSSGYDHIQYFATGRAATFLSLHKEVRQAMLSKINPELTVGREYGPDDNTACIKTWIKADEKNNLQSLRTWMAKNQVTVRITDFLNGAALNQARQQAVTDLKISCPSH